MKQKEEKKPEDTLKPPVSALQIFKDKLHQTDKPKPDLLGAL